MLLFTRCGNFNEFFFATLVLFLADVATLFV